MSIIQNNVSVKVMNTSSKPQEVLGVGTVQASSFKVSIVADSTVGLIKSEVANKPWLSFELIGGDGILGEEAAAIPSHTTVVRDAITDMVEGDMIFNSTDQVLNIFDGSNWVVVASGGGGAAVSASILDNGPTIAGIGQTITIAMSDGAQHDVKVNIYDFEFGVPFAGVSMVDLGVTTGTMLFPTSAPSKAGAIFKTDATGNLVFDATSSGDGTFIMTAQVLDGTMTHANLTWTV